MRAGRGAWPPSRETAGTVTLVAAVTWFWLGGPRVAEALEEVRVERQALPSPREVALRAADPGLDPGARARLLAWQGALGETLAAELRWNRVLAGILDEDRRARGAALAASAAPNPPVPGTRGLDGDVLALVGSLQERHGFVDPPAVSLAAAKDDWTGVDRRGRARFAQALVEAGELDDEEAGELLAASLAFLHAQATAIRAQAGAGE